MAVAPSYRCIEKACLKNFPRYIAVQVVAYGLDMGGFLAALMLLGLGPLLANVAGKILAGVVAFVLHHSFTFELDAKDYRREQAMRYFLLLVLNIPFASLVFSGSMLLVEPEVLAKFAADVVCVFLTYWLSKSFVFVIRPSVSKSMME